VIVRIQENQAVNRENLMPEEGIEPTLTVKWTGFWVQCVFSYAHLKIIGGTKRIEKRKHFPRILIRRTGADLCCNLLDEPALTESTLYSCWSTSPNISNNYLLSLLNSKLFNYYIKSQMIKFHSEPSEDTDYPEELRGY
jgi:hypothetical protein